MNPPTDAAEILSHPFGASSGRAESSVGGILPSRGRPNSRVTRGRDGIAAARARGKRSGRHPLDPEKIAAALELVKAGLSRTVAARQLGLGRSTVYREVGGASIAR